MIIPYRALPEETLLNLVQEFVTREGTDYSHSDIPLENKVRQVLAQLEKGTAFIVFDAESNSCHILPSNDVPEIIDHE